MILDKSDSKDVDSKKNFKAVIFAEPGTVGGATGLLPGDRLLEVNGVKVETRTREEVIEMIKSSEESVTVTVSEANGNIIHSIMSFNNIIIIHCRFSQSLN